MVTTTRPMTLPFLDGVGPPAGRSVWELMPGRRPVLRLEHKGDLNHHTPNDWHMVLYDDGTIEDRHHPRHPWSRGFMALELIGTLQDYAEKMIGKGWRIAAGEFENEPTK